MKKSLAIEKLEKHINMLIKNPLRDPTFLTEQILDFCVEELGMMPPTFRSTISRIPEMDMLPKYLQHEVEIIMPKAHITEELNEWEDE